MSPVDSEVALREICCDNEKAMEFLVAAFRWFHWIDDVVDKDVKWEPAEVIRVNLEAAVVFSNNEFFQYNRNLLVPLVLQAARSFADSCQWAKRKSRRDRHAADVLKSFYHEIFWHVAYLTAAQAGKDGWNHMSMVTAKYRKFDYDFKD